MKIPGKSPLQTITKKLSVVDKSNINGSIKGSTKNIVSLDVNQVLYKKSKKSFSVRILNYVEPYLIKGQRYTLFYTEIDHNLKINDRVFITGGNYDSDLIIQDNKFNKLSDGYIVQYVDKTKVVLDIEYTGEYPWTEEPIDNFTKVYVASTQDEFNYYIQTTSTRDFDSTSNRFSSYEYRGNNNILYINGTFSISGSDYGILGFSSSSTLTYSNSFLVLSGTSSGYLTDITSDVISGSFSSYLSQPRFVISSGYSIYTPPFSYLYLTFTEKHGLTSTTSGIKINYLQGTGTFSFWNGITTTFGVVDEYTLYTSVIANYVSNITNGVLTKNGIGYDVITNNSNLKIINGDFEKSGNKFKKDYTYYFDTESSTWKVNRHYLKPIMTEQNFRNGVFKKGEYNQGLLGTHQETINYNGVDVNFSLGTVLNVKWYDGNIGKGNGNDLSYFTSFDEFGLPNIKTNTKNNAGLGYNYIYDSYVKKSIIDNGTFNDTIIGSYSVDLILSNYLSSQSTTYSVTIKSGNYFNSDILFTDISNSSIFSSFLSNSRIYNSKSVNSEFVKSLFLKSKFTSDKIVKIKEYDEKLLKWHDGYQFNTFKLYKFYIDDESFLRFRDFQSFYFDGLKIDKVNLGVLNFFDDKFSIDSYYASSDTNNSGKTLKRVITQLSTKEENLKIVGGLSYSLSDNSKYGYPSIDILICATPSSNVEDFNSRIIDEFYGPYIFNIIDFTTTTYWDTTTESVFRVLYSGGSPTFSATSSVSLYEGLNNLSIGTWTYSGNIFNVDGAYSYQSITLTDVDGGEYNINSTQSSRKAISDSLKTLDISKAYIVDSDFKSGLFEGSTWISGNYINYNKDHTFRTLQNSDSYGDIQIDNTTGTFNFSINSDYRKSLIDVDDILFLNALYYDTTAYGGDNLVRLPDSYKVSNISLGGNGRIIQMYDIVNGTSSNLYNVPYLPSSGSSVLTKYGENGFNYAHPVKFSNSKIQSGIFRRAYFNGCKIENQLFNNLDKEPVLYDNWRSLLLSDILFSNNNNEIKSGLVINSSFMSGSDRWLNGIFYNSIWNVQSFTWSNFATNSTIYTTGVNKFKNGIVKQSRWVNGIFENGLFYKNKSNVAFTTDIYNDLTPAYYRYRDSSDNSLSRYSWINGIFENGLFELSNFESGDFLSGDFYNSTFLTGNALGGNFGKRNLKYPLTRIASGSFSNVNVISSEFKTENPTGQMDGQFQIDWYSGVFNNGLFGVKVDSASYSNLGPAYPFNANWFDGTFNNGIFTDIANWRNGDFNNGKFISYYGYPFTTAASYSSAGSSSFAWQDGIFNGGEFGNASIGANSTWYNGEFNGGIFRGRYWNNGLFTKGYFIGSGTVSTRLSDISHFVSDFSDNFYGFWNDGIVSEVKDKFVKNKKTFTKLEREFTKKKSKLTVEFKNSLWLNGTFSHNNAIFQNSVWQGGIFERGKFYRSSFNPYVSYVINGNFQQIESENLKFWNQLYTDYDADSTELIGASLDTVSSAQFQNDPSKKIVFTGTSSILNITQTAGLRIGETYTVRVVVNENYNTEIRFGNFSSSLRNRNFTESIAYGSSYSSWILASTSSSGGAMPSLTASIGSPGNVYYKDGGTGDSSGYIIYPGILIPGNTYTVKFYTFNELSFGLPYIGSCDYSQVVIENEVLTTDFIVNTNLTYSVPNGASNDYFITFDAVYTDLVINTKPYSSSTEYNMSGIILTGNSILTSSDISSKTSITYTFNAEGPDFAFEFIPKTTSVTNAPPIWDNATSSISLIEVVKGTSGFNLDNCLWDNGIFEDSEFYVSKWNTGKWISGTAVGMIWKNGIANYMNAYNIYWEGGLWRNGNWNGSPFGYENINENGCLYTYETEISLILSSPFNGLDLGSSPNNGLTKIAVDTSSIANGGSFSFYNSVFSPPLAAFTASYQDPELDPDGSLNFVNTSGLLFIKGGVNQFNIGTRYRVIVNIGTVSIANYPDLDKVGIQFSIGRPSSANVAYGENSGIYEGSIYASSTNIANGEDFISDFHKLEDLENHIGSIATDLLIPSVDGYLASVGGSITETLTARDDGRFYLHISPYGTSDFYIDSISIQEEICEQRVEVNDGYVSDIITNVGLYRQSSNDIGYREVFINDAFTVSVDTTWSAIQDQPYITSLSFTQSVFPSQQRWKYATSYVRYGNTVNCGSGTTLFSGFSPTSFSSVVWPKVSQVINNTNYYIDYNSAGNYLYALNTLGNRNIFRDFGQYDIEIKYVLQYGPASTPPTLGNSQVTYTPNISFRVDVGYYSGINNGGFTETITEAVRAYRIGCSGTLWFGQTDELTWSSTFEPTAIGATYSDLDRLKIRKVATVNNTKIIITSARVVKKISKYDPQYNCATYSIMSATPSYSDSLILPPIQLIGGLSNGNIIATRFGNGIFTSGTSSAFSSIWENGVWNEGLRYDKYVYSFDNLSIFPGTTKPFSFQGVIDIKSPKIGNVPSNLDKNLTRIKTSSKNWIISLVRTSGYIYYDGISIDQQDFYVSDYFKIGDKVSVGNIVSLDLNNNRKLIRDAFTVIEVSNDVIRLQVTLNFPIRRISKDSDDHLIYVSKNVWINGAFLNGIFKGVWNNGLFKGRPYITKMIDTHWIDGRFEGGRFKGLTLSVVDDSDSENTERQIDIYPSGLIQNFSFKDENVGFNSAVRYVDFMKYNSWINVNYFTSSMTNLFKDSTYHDKGLSSKRSILNLNGYPTKDVLSSLSNFKNSYDDNFKNYSLGWKYETYDDYIDNPYFTYPVNSTQSLDFSTNTKYDTIKLNGYSIYSTSSVPGLYEFVEENNWRPRVLNQSLAAEYTSNTEPDDSDVLRVRGGYDTGANILDNTNTYNISKFRYSVIEFAYNYYEFDSSGGVNATPSNFAFPYFLNQPETKKFSTPDAVLYTSTTPVILRHNLTPDTIKKEYFYNKSSLGMVLAMVIEFYDSWASPAWGVLIPKNSGLTAGDIVYLSKRDKSINIQIEGTHSVVNVVPATADLYPGASASTLYDVALIPEVQTGYTFTPTGTDGGTLFVYRPYSAYFDYIKMYEVDAVPFFLYATESRINQSISAPLSAVAPQINYSDTEFSLIDSINITETLFETAENPVINLSGAGTAESKGSNNSFYNVLSNGLLPGARKVPNSSKGTTSKGTTTFTSSSKGSPSA